MRWLQFRATANRDSGLAGFFGAGLVFEHGDLRRRAGQTPWLFQFGAGEKGAAALRALNFQRCQTRNSQ